jgi:hypothetical protein
MRLTRERQQDLTILSEVDRKGPQRQEAVTPGVVAPIHEVRTTHLLGGAAVQNGLGGPRGGLRHFRGF